MNLRLNKIWLLVTALLTGMVLDGHAQQGWNRFAISEPVFGTAKVDKLVEKQRAMNLHMLRQLDSVNRKEHQDTIDINDSYLRYHQPMLTASQYRLLSAHEKFSYNVIYPEQYFQNCSIVDFKRWESADIFARLPQNWAMKTWSTRQIAFFKEHRDSVMIWMQEELKKTDRVGLNFKWVLVVVDAKKLIPDLIAIYDRQRGGKYRDLDILTVLMELMTDAKFGPWMKTELYQTLYGSPSADYYSKTTLTAQREEEVKRMAALFSTQK